MLVHAQKSHNLHVCKQAVNISCVISCAARIQIWNNLLTTCNNLVDNTKLNFLQDCSDKANTVMTYKNIGYTNFVLSALL